MPDVLASDAFSMTTLTDKVSKLPPKNLQLAAFFEAKPVAGEDIQVDIESGAVTILSTVLRGDVATHVTGQRTKSARKIESVKIGTTVELTASDISKVRQFGSETLAETFQNVLEPRLDDAIVNIDATHENMRAGAFRGIVLDADGTTTLHNFYTIFGLTPPAVIYLDLDALTDLGELRGQFDAIKNGIRDGSGRLPIAGFVAVAGRGAYQALVNHPVVQAAYERWDEGRWRRDANSGGFIWQGIEFIEYIGSAVADDEILFAPKAYGIFRTVFTSPDEPELANTMGRPVYVVPQPQDTSKSWSAEVASFPLHYCTRPDLLRRAVIGADPAP